MARNAYHDGGDIRTRSVPGRFTGAFKGLGCWFSALGTYPTRKLAAEAVRTLLAIRAEKRQCTQADIDRVRKEIIK